MKDLC